MRVAQSAALAVNITRWTVFLSCGAAMRVAQSAALAVNITRWTVFVLWRGKILPLFIRRFVSERSLFL